jgi:LysM domain
MASKIARTSEYATITVAALLGLSCLVSACSSSQPETTGSIAGPQQVRYNTPPPVIHTASTVPASQPAPRTYYAPRAVAYAPRRTAVRRPTCSCNTPRRSNGDVTASIPRAQPASYGAPARVDFVVHTIGRNETLYSISRLYRTRVADIAAVNRLDTNAPLHSGELLVVPTTH